MRTLIHTATAMAVLMLYASIGVAQESQPDAASPFMPEQQPAATTENRPVDMAVQTDTTTAPQDKPAQSDESAQPEEAQTDEEAQPDQAQPSEEDSAQTSGPMTATDKIVAHFMALDTDENDLVSFEEYMTMVQQRAIDRFTTMDTNGDGEVTAEEYRAFWKERKAQWYRLRR